MSSRYKEIKHIITKDGGIKEESEKNFDKAPQDTVDNTVKPAVESVRDDRLVECEKRLENLKDELKTLKKLKKRQEKISKLEEEKNDVMMELEREKNGGRRPKGHHRH